MKAQVRERPLSWLSEGMARGKQLQSRDRAPAKPHPATVAQGLLRFCLGQNEKPLAASTVCCQAQDSTKRIAAQIWGCNLCNAATSSPKHRV